jgi:hypothetical protein
MDSLYIFNCLKETLFETCWTKTIEIFGTDQMSAKRLYFDEKVGLKFEKDIPHAENT